MNNLSSCLAGVWLLSMLACSCNAGAATPPADTDVVPVEIEQLTIDQLMSQGQALMDADQLDDAMVVFEQVLARQPEHAGAIYQKGVILVRSNDTARGIDLIERASVLAPDNLVYKEALASMYEVSGRMDEALAMNNKIVDLAASGSDAFNRAQRNVEFITTTMLARQGKMPQAEQGFALLAVRYPDDLMIRYSLGVALMLQDKLGEAETAFHMARDINPAYANTYLSLAALYEKQGRLSQAYEMLTEVLNLDASSNIARRAQLRMYIIEGRLLLAEGNTAEALDIFKRARELAPDDVEVLFELGLLYAQVLDWPGVIDVSERFLQVIPNRPDVRLGLAKAYVNTRQLDLAAAELQHVIDLAPETSQGEEARFQLQRLMASSAGRAILSRQRDDQILELQQSLTENPDDIETMRLLVTLLLQQERWQDARIPLEQLLAMEPTVALTHTSLALVYDKLGLYGQAVEAYAYGISLELDPDIAARIAPTLTLAAAKALYTSGDMAAAAQLFTEILAREPANAEAWFFVGLVYFTQDRIIEAVDSFQRVLQYVPGHLGARLNLAHGYHRLKREEDAIEEFRNALQFSPEGPLAENIKEQMQSVEKSIRGFSGGMSYVLAYDDNSNLNNDNPEAEYRTDLSPRLFFRYKAENGLRWLLSTAPTYSSYHNGQFDFLNTLSSITASVSQGRITMGGGLRYQASLGLINARRSSSSTTIHADWDGLFKLPLVVRPWDDNRVLTNTSVLASYTEFDSLESSFYSAYSYSVAASFNQPIAERTVLAMTYRSSLSDNKYAEGSDYAFRGKGIDVRLERGIAAGISINGGYSSTWMDYLYPDSTTSYTRYRSNRVQSFIAGINYQFHPSLQLFANAVWSSNQSNLPVGFILNAQDVVEGQQSPSLGDYSRMTLSIGVALNL